MTKALVIALLLSLLGLAAPSTATADSPLRRGAPYEVAPFRARASDDDRLERAWQVWLARRERRYTTAVAQSCFCPSRRPVVTEVRGRTVTSVTRQDRSTQLMRRGHAVPDLFRLLRDAYVRAAEVDVRYRDGVPVRVFVDWDRTVVDEELALSVRVR